MALSELSDDCLEYILHPLSGSDIVHLMRTGNQRLYTHVRRNVKNWKIATARFSKFPFSVLDDPKLVSLEVHMIAYHREYPLMPDIRELSLVSAHNSLLSLQFDFYGCLSILEASSLSKLAVNLQTLVCVDHYRPLKLEYLQNLPNKLQKLQLAADTYQTPLKLSLDDFVALLPSTIEYIQLPQIYLTEPIINESQNQLDWPIGLSTLLVYSVPVPFIFDHPPPNIQVLRSKPPVLPKGTIISMARLPKTLIEIEMISYSSLAPTFALDAPMPPHMRSFVAHIPTALDLSQLTFLAPTLEKFEPFDAIQSIYGSVPLGELLPNLSEFTVSSEDDLNTQRWPPNARSMRWGIVTPNEAVPLLPRYLDTLIVIASPHIPLERLPRSLKSLGLRFSKKDHFPILNATQWSSLPPRLDALETNLLAMESAECLSEMPKNLMIKIPRLEPEDPACEKKMSEYLRYTCLLNDKGLMQHLPIALKLLKIEINAVCEWPRWVNCLALSTPNLEHLDIYLRLGAEMPPANEYLYSLPGSLKHLTIPVDVYQPLPLDIYSHFPRSLTYLKLDYHDEPAERIQPFLTNDHYAHLPTSLTELHHSRSSSYYSEGAASKFNPEAHLTPEIFSILPRFLVWFPFSTRYRSRHDWKDAWVQYCNEIKWFGFPPRK